MLGALAVALLAALPSVAGHGEPTAPSAARDARKQPMRFTWYDTGAGRPGLVTAVGTVTGDTPAAFERLARGRDLRGITVVLNSGGGSVLDTLTLGRRWRDLDITTTVGTATELAERRGRRVVIRPDAACESMCAFLLLAGTFRDVPPGARVRVHQIWMGDRASDAQAASYTAQDMATVQRDVGRLARYTFEMGGSGALLSLALSVPPWEPLYELSPDELAATGLVTPRTDAVASPKPVQDRLAVTEAGAAPPVRVEAAATGGSAAPAGAAR